jgi:hypothetical protein
MSPADDLAIEAAAIRARTIALTRRASQLYGHDTVRGAEASSAGELVLIGLAGFARVFDTDKAES